MTEIASAYISLITKMPGVKDEIGKTLGGSDVQGEVEKAGKKSGTNWGKALAVGVAAGTVVVAGAATMLAKSVIQSYGELEQNLGGAEAVFGQHAGTLLKISEEAYKNMGVSQSEYLANVNKMGALFQGSGVEQAKSLDLTTKAMQRAADMASVMGIDMQVAMDSVTGAAKGNFTMMDNIGVAMNATAIEAYAASKGMEDWSFATASAAEKAELAMEMFLENTEQYAGNFAKEATETVSGSFGLMSAAWSELIAGLGNEDADLSRLTSNLIEAFKAVIKNVTPVVVQMIRSLPQVLQTLFKEAVPALQELFGELAGSVPFGGLAKQVFELMQQLSPLMIAFEVLKPVLPVLAAAFQQVAGSLGGALLDVVSTIMPLLVELAGVFAGALAGILPVVAELLVAVAEIVGQLFAAVAPLIVQIMTGLMPVINAIIPVIVELFEAFLPIVEAILPVLLSLFETLAPMVVRLMNVFIPLLDPIVALLKPLMDLVSVLLPPLIELMGFLFEAIIPPLMLAIDGLVPVITGVVSAISGYLIPVIDMISDVMGGLIDFLVGVFTGDWEKAWKGIVKVFTGLWEGMQNIAKSIINGIIDIVNGAIAGINNIASGVSDLTGGVISFAIPSIPKLADGGVVRAQPGGILANIGEGRYDEAVVPLSPSILGQLAGNQRSLPREVVLRVGEREFVAYVEEVADGRIDESTSVIGANAMNDVGF